MINLNFERIKNRIRKININSRRKKSKNEDEKFAQIPINKLFLLTIKL